MVCGSKRYVVEAEVNREEKTELVVARTPAEARKKFRAEHGGNAYIKTVKNHK